MNAKRAKAIVIELWNNNEWYEDDFRDAIIDAFEAELEPTDVDTDTPLAMVAEVARLHAQNAELLLNLEACEVFIRICGPTGGYALDTLNTVRKAIRHAQEGTVDMSTATEQAKCDAWNILHPVRTEVVYWPHEDVDSNHQRYDGERSRTQCEAFVDATRQPAIIVVPLDGYGGFCASIEYLEVGCILSKDGDSFSKTFKHTW